MDTVTHSESPRHIVANAFIEVNARGEIRLLGQRCRDCGTRFFPGGRSNCTRCYGAHLETVELDRSGTVDCFTVVRQAPQGYHGVVPYAIGNVALGASVMVIAQLIGKDPDTWRCGDKVVSCALDLPVDREGEALVRCYAFRPAP